jgi:hypothetical protein
MHERARSRLDGQPLRQEHQPHRFDGDDLTKVEGLFVDRIF